MTDLTDYIRANENARKANAARPIIDKIPEVERVARRLTTLLEAVGREAVVERMFEQGRVAELKRLQDTVEMTVGFGAAFVRHSARWTNHPSLIGPPKED